MLHNHIVSENQSKDVMKPLSADMFYNYARAFQSAAETILLSIPAKQKSRFFRIAHYPGLLSSLVDLLQIDAFKEGVLDKLFDCVVKDNNFAVRAISSSDCSYSHLRL